MRRYLIAATSALVLAIVPAGILPLTAGVAGGLIVVSAATVAMAQDLDAANQAVEAAKAALEDAKVKGEGVKEARKALKAARQESKRLAKEAKSAARKPSAEAAAKPAVEEKAEATAAKEPAPKKAAKSQTPGKKPVSDDAPADQPVSQEAESQKAEPKKTKKEQRAKAKSDDKKAARKAKRKDRKKASEVETPTVAESEPKAPKKRKPVATAKPGAPKADAPVAKPVAKAPIEKQIKEAAEKPASVIPDDVSKAQQTKLRRAEKKRREASRKKRGELLGAAGVGAVVGALIPALGGKIIGDEGDRLIVERDGRIFVRKDESALFRDRGQKVEREGLRNGRTRETIYHRNGSKIITVRDPGGYALRRVKVKPNGERIILFDAGEDRKRRPVNYDRQLPPLRINISLDQYIVSGARFGRSQLAEILEAPPVERVSEDYTLREVRESQRLRSIVRRVDLDAITFDTGSATIRASQVPYLADIAGGMLDVIDRNPAAVFLVEGHTDAVGGEIYNLTLSDRRAETVARILVDAFELPPENLVVEGYGEQYLKIDTDGDERRNRRVAIRNITPLLTAESN